MSARAGSSGLLARSVVWRERRLKIGLLDVGDVGGIVHRLDAVTGATVWKHDVFGAIWACFLLAGDRLYDGNQDDTVTVLRAGQQKEVLAEIEMDASL
jgi:hypothetical protein